MTNCDQATDWIFAVGAPFKAIDHRFFSRRIDYENSAASAGAVVVTASSGKAVELAIVRDETLWKRSIVIALESIEHVFLARCRY
jgi:hypothetical protein